MPGPRWLKWVLSGAAVVAVGVMLALVLPRMRSAERLGSEPVAPTADTVARTPAPAVVEATASRDTAVVGRSEASAKQGEQPQTPRKPRPAPVTSGGIARREPGHRPMAATAPGARTEGRVLLLIDANAACRVKVDGEERGPAIPGTPLRVEVVPGDHVVYATTEDGQEWKKVVTIRGPGQEVVTVPVRETREARAARLLAQGIVERGGLMWTVRDNGSDVDWREAKAYCEACRLGGYTDWRLPTIEELQGLYDGNRSTRATQWHSQEVHIVAPFELSTTWVWSGMLQGSTFAVMVSFNYYDWTPLEFGPHYSGRALCVRRSGE